MSYSSAVAARLSEAGHSEIKIWGFEPTNSNRSEWETISPGDYILFTHEGRGYLARVTDPPKAESKKLPSNLWPDSRWDKELLVFFDGLFEVDVDNAWLRDHLAEKIGRRGSWLARVSDLFVKKMLREYGTLVRAFKEMKSWDQLKIAGPGEGNPDRESGEDSMLQMFKEHVRSVNRTSAALEGSIDRPLITIIKSREVKSIFRLGGPRLLFVSTQDGTTTFELDVMGEKSHLLGLDDLKHLTKEETPQKVKELPPMKEILQIMGREVELAELLRGVARSISGSNYLDGLSLTYALIREAVMVTYDLLRVAITEFSSSSSVELNPLNFVSEPQGINEDKRKEVSIVEIGLEIIRAARELSLSGYNHTTAEGIVREVKKRRGKDFPVDEKAVELTLRKLGAFNMGGYWGIGFLSRYKLSKLREYWIRKMKGEGLRQEGVNDET